MDDGELQFARPKGLTESDVLYIAGLGARLGHSAAVVRERLSGFLAGAAPHSCAPPSRVVVPADKSFVFALFADSS